MRRFPRFLLLAVLGTAGAARAGDLPDPAHAAPVTAEATSELAATDSSPLAEDPPAAGAAADASAPPSAGTPAPAEAAAAVPVLAPAASVDGKADEEKEGSFPLHASATLSNSFGNGLVAPVADLDAFQPQPNWATGLKLGGSAGLPKLDFLPKMTVGASMDFSVANWIDSYASSGVYARVVRASDIGLSFAMPVVYTEEFTKVELGLKLSSRIPTSITSRQQNLFTSLGASVPVGWTSPEASWGMIGVNYSLGGRVALYTADAPTIPCNAAVSLAGVVTDPLENADLPLSYGREAEILPNGECVLSGRQGVASVTNSLAASWSLKDHSVEASLAWAVGFLRPVSDRPDLRSAFASDQAFAETISGNLSYGYKVPVDFPLSLSAGIGSSQPPFRVGDGGEQEIRNPFWDFFTPASNYSAAFVDVSIGI